MGIPLWWWCVFVFVVCVRSCKTKRGTLCIHAFPQSYTHMYVIRNPWVNTLNSSVTLLFWSTSAHFQPLLLLLHMMHFHFCSSGRKTTQKRKDEIIDQRATKWKRSQVEQCNVACVFAFKMREKYGQIICSEYRLNPSGGDITVWMGVSSWSRQTCFDCWVKCGCRRKKETPSVPLCGILGKNWLLILLGLVHSPTVTARKIQITKEHIGLIQFAFNSANDFPSPPVSLCTALPFLFQAETFICKNGSSILVVTLLFFSDSLYYKVCHQWAALRLFFLPRHVKASGIKYTMCWVRLITKQRLLQGGLRK